MSLIQTIQMNAPQDKLPSKCSLQLATVKQKSISFCVLNNGPNLKSGQCLLQYFRVSGLTRSSNQMTRWTRYQAHHPRMEGQTIVRWCTIHPWFYFSFCLCSHSRCELICLFCKAKERLPTPSKVSPSITVRSCIASIIHDA